MEEQESGASSLTQPKRNNQGKKTDYDDMLTEMSHLDANAFAGHLVDTIADEVALEGLDGITIQALKVRLEGRPNFEIEGFEDIGSAVWNQIKRSKNFTFYYLPVARPDLVPYSWDQYRDERGNAFEPLHSPEDIYPYFPVEDKEKGIRGSCEHYHTRKDVSYIVRRISYLKAIQLFGNRLVIVVTPLLREKALFGANYMRYQGLSIIQYCIMERVARSRYSGEITRGKISSSCMKIPPKTQFYQRKALLKQGLLLRQNASIKFAYCKCPAIVTLFHLPRFYRRIEPISSLNIRTIFTWLNSSEEKCIPVETIISTYGKHTHRGIQAQFPTLLETAWHQLPATTTDNDDDRELLDGEPKKKNKPRTIRVLRLKTSDVAVQAQLIKKVLEGQYAEEEGSGEAAGGGEQEQDCEENVNLTSANSYSDTQVLRPSHHFINVSDTCFLYRALIRAGTAGLTLADLGFLYLTQLETRSTGRILLRGNICKEGVVKLHKQKAFTYTLKNFASEGVRINAALEEKLMRALTELACIRVRMVGRNIPRMIPPVKFAEPPSNVLAKPVSKSNRAESNENESKVTIVSSALPNSEYVQVIGKPAFISLADETTVDMELITSGNTNAVFTLVSPEKNKSPKKSANARTSKSKSFKYPSPPPVSPKKMPTLCLVRPSDDGTPTPVSKKKLFAANTTQLLPPIPEKLPVEGTKTTQTIVTNKATESMSVGPQLTPPLVSATYLDESDEEGNLNENDPRRGDHIDEEIRNRMSRQRVDWNQNDDRFIMIAYIATALFVPKCNFTKIFIFNSIQIRDLLMKRMKGKSTKTSPAIRRRIHFLMKQKPYFNMYLGLMGAAVRDDFLYETLIKEYLRPPQPKIYITPSDEALEAVINYLYKKFDEEEFVATDTKTSVNELETILFLRQLKRAEFYWNALIFVIFCPMGARTSERNRFRFMWRKLVATAEASDVEPEAVKSSEVQPRRATGIARIPITKRPAVAPRNVEVDDEVENQDVEELDEDKKALEEYYREYCFKFLKFLVKQLKIVFNNMLMLSSVGNSKNFQLIYFDSRIMSSAVSLGPNLCLSIRECDSDSEIRIWGARCLIIDYVFCGNRARALDKSVVERTNLPLEKAASLLSSARIFISSKRTGLLVLSRTNLRQFLCGLPSSSFDETLDFLNYIDEASNVDSLACISIGALFAIVELTDYFKSSINVIESVFTLNDEWAPIYDGISHEEEFPKPKIQKKGKKRKLKPDSVTVPSNDAPHFKRARLSQEEEEDIEDLYECFEDIERNMFVPRSQSNVGLEEGENYISSSTNALRLLRIRLNQAGVHMPRKQFTGFVEKDFFTINLPSLEFIFPKRNGLNHRISGSSHPYGGEELKELRKALVELVYHSVTPTLNTNNSQIPHMEKHLRKYGILFELINLAGNVGVSGNFLKSKFERKSLVKGLRYLLDCKLIFSVGVVQRRFVSYNNVNDWIIAVRPKANVNVVGHVIMRPWITALGGISWSTVSRLFTSLLGQLQKPAVPFDDLAESLSPTLSPVEVVVLIEAFVKLKYLTVYKVHEKQATVFSGHPKDKSEIEYNAETLIDTENMYIEVSPYTTFLYAQLQHAFHKASKKQLSNEKSQPEQYQLKRRRRRKAKSANEHVDAK